MKTEKAKLETLLHICLLWSSLSTATAPFDYELCFLFSHTLSFSLTLGFIWFFGLEWQTKLNNGRHMSGGKQVDGGEWADVVNGFFLCACEMPKALLPFCTVLFVFCFCLLYFLVLFFFSRYKQPTSFYFILFFKKKTSMTRPVYSNQIRSSVIMKTNQVTPGWSDSVTRPVQ